MLQKTAVRYMERRHWRPTSGVRRPKFTTGTLWTHGRAVTRPVAPVRGSTDRDSATTAWPTPNTLP